MTSADTLSSTMLTRKIVFRNQSPIKDNKCVRLNDEEIYETVGTKKSETRKFKDKCFFK